MNELKNEFTTDYDVDDSDDDNWILYAHGQSVTISSGIKSEEDKLKAGDKATITSKDNYTDSNNKTATIPSGFTISKISGETNIEEGLVIYLIPEGTTLTDEQWKTKASGTNFAENTVYNVQTQFDQFVWIPVPEIDKMIMCKGHTDDTPSNKCVLELNDEKTELICTKHNKEICGRLYCTITSGYKSDLTTQTWTNNEGYREPDILTAPANPENVPAYLSAMGTPEYSLEKINTEFMRMAVSVAKYGGFWVGRYEASLDNDKTKVIAGNTSMNASESTSKWWYGLYTRQNNFAQNQSIIESVGSQMIWGSQYDAIMNWMAQDSNISVNSYHPKAGSTRNIKRITGATLHPDGTTVINDKLKNIYDLLGNSFEYTQTVYSNSYKDDRGGSHQYEYYLSNNMSISPTNGEPSRSSRPTLYIK